MTTTDGPIHWQPDGAVCWAGIIPQITPSQALFWIQRSEFLSHWAAPMRYRWTLTSTLPGLDLNETAEGSEVPQELFAKAEQARQAYVAWLNGERG